MRILIAVLVAIGSAGALRPPAAQAPAVRPDALRFAVIGDNGTGDRYEYETEFLIAAGRAGFRITSVRVPTTYGAPSHFRSWADSMRVVRAIWKNRSRGVN